MYMKPGIGVRSGAVQRREPTQEMRSGRGEWSRGRLAARGMVRGLVLRRWGHDGCGGRLQAGAGRNWDLAQGLGVGCRDSPRHVGLKHVESGRLRRKERLDAVAPGRASDVRGHSWGGRGAK